MNVAASVADLVGRTPLVHLSRMEAAEGVCCTLLAKIESQNPAGSVKDRVARQMIEDAEACGRLRPGSVIIEPTSGNTGIGLAALAAARGYRAMIVMPDTMSAERRLLIEAYGAEVVLTDGSLGMAGAIERARALASEIEGAFVPDQFANPSNARAHYRTTGPELWDDTDGCVDVFVAGVGTGGTLTGVGSYLKERKPSVHVVAVEPARSAVLSGRAAGPHGLQGIGAGFIPEVLDVRVADEVVPITEEEAYRAARALAATEGLLTGISSGAALAAALRVGRRPELRGKTVVVLLPDTGERHLSTDLYRGSEGDA